MTGWDGMGWDGTVWHGMAWDRAGWDGIKKMKKDVMGCDLWCRH